MRLGGVIYVQHAGEAVLKDDGYCKQRANARSLHQFGWQQGGVFGMGDGNGLFVLLQFLDKRRLLSVQAEAGELFQQFAIDARRGRTVGLGQGGHQRVGLLIPQEDGYAVHRQQAARCQDNPLHHLAHIHR